MTALASNRPDDHQLLHHVGRLSDPVAIDTEAPCSERAQWCLQYC